jgi:S-layer homology domain
MRKTLLATAVAAVMAIGITATASHNSFSDVPDDHLFFNGVEWALANGITVGCGDGSEFCPDQPVTRGQMVTFLKRYDENLGGFDIPIGLGITGRSVTQTPFNGNGAVSGLSMDLQIPLSGVLIISASADTSNLSQSDVFSCGINTGGSPGLAQGDSWRQVDLSTNTFDTCVTQTAVLVSPGSMVARLVVTGALATTEIGAGNISAVLYLDIGSFGLLGDINDQVEPRETADLPSK